MQTFNRICLEDYKIVDEGGITFTLQRGKEYTTSREQHGTVMVFSQYWVRVPIAIFAGEREFTPPDSMERRTR